MTSLLIRRPCEDTERSKGRRLCGQQSQKLECSAYKPRDASNCQKPPKAGKKQGRILSQSLRNEHDSANTLILCS